MTIKDRSESILGTILRLSLVTLIILSLLGARVSVQAARAQGSGPQVTLTPPAAVQTQVVTYTGSGFTPSGSVDLAIESGYLSLSYSLGSTSANSTGFIDGQFEVTSNILPGTRQINFTDVSTGANASASIAVVAFVDFLTNPVNFPGALVPGNISISSTCGTPSGQTLFNSCLNFDATAILPTPSTGWRFDHWETTGNKTDEPPGFGWGISCSPLNDSSTNCSVFRNGGILEAFFSAAITIITNPVYIGSVSFGSCSGAKYTNGSIAWRPELRPNITNVPVCASPSYGFAFIGWTSTGGITVTDNISPATTLELTGPGTLTANYGVSISMQTGWNLISLPLVPSDPLIGDLLKPLLAKNEVVSVWTYAGTPRFWQSYVPGKGGTLTTMVDGNGYWIFMNSADNLNVTGTVVPYAQTPPAYPLVSGWNLLGFKPEPIITNETVSQYLTSITGKYDVNNVWVFNNLNQSWIRTNSSYLLQPGEAIWILMTSSATLKP